MNENVTLPPEYDIFCNGYVANLKKIKNVINVTWLVKKKRNNVINVTWLVIQLPGSQRD